MSYMNHPIDDTPTIRGVAAADIINPAFTAVAFDGNGKLAVPAAGDVIIGIVLATYDECKAGDPLDVQIKDITYWMANGTIAAGDLLKTDATGKCVAAESGDVANAIAMEAGTAGNPVKVMICHTNKA